MLINFCQKCLETRVTCSTVSNDGYEVTNLTTDSDKGFLAYSCIKPPIHIDLTFICDIQINHILIWPSVGAQKSSGFELSVKSGNEHQRASIGFLSPSHSGILFYRRDVDQKSFCAPMNFLHRYTQLPNGMNMNRVRNLRLSIIKTANSVPAVGRLEIWARVSPFNGKDTVAHVHSLLRIKDPEREKVVMEKSRVSSKNVAKELRDSIEELPSVPECFLDPITCNIMIQPIVLPSGVTIDQSTLEKHGKAEATWGRTLSDPFTGIPFNDSRKPIIASALKARIDKFLLENNHTPDVKKMPRLSGHKQIVMSLRNRSLKLSEIMSHSENLLINRKIDKSINCSDQTIKLPVYAAQSKINDESRAHRLPIIPMCSKRGIAKITSKKPKMKNIAISSLKMQINAGGNDGNKDSNLDQSVKTVLSNLQRFDGDSRAILRNCLNNCKCVTNIFYKLPCKHILCRDALMSIKDSRCLKCHSQYNSRDLERIHAPLGLG